MCSIAADAVNDRAKGGKKLLSLLGGRADKPVGQRVAEAVSSPAAVGPAATFLVRIRNTDGTNVAAHTRNGIHATAYPRA